MKNLLSCNEGLLGYIQSFKELEGAKILRAKNNLFNIEDNLLKLAASGMTDGTSFYLIFKVNGASFCRYFESGSFYGFLESNDSSSKLEQHFSSKIDYIISTYTKEDINFELKRNNEELFKNKRKRCKY